MESRYEKNKEEIKKNKKEIKRIKKDKYRKRNRIIIILVATLILLLLLWGKFGAVNILKTNYFTISSNNIPKSFNDIRIVHFSDVHYSSNTDEKDLNKIVNRINEYKPDIVVFTGDLIDKNYKENDDDIKTIAKSFSKINARLGKYAISGDNDYKSDNFESIIYDSKFTLLKNNYDTVYNTDNNPILIYGFDDVNKGYPETKTLSKKEIKNIAYKIALVHEPDYANEIANDYGLDLILAGHSLYGQVKLPGIKPLHLPKGARDYYKKEYDINGTKLFISGGTGQTIYNYRLFTMPSINVYNLKSD